MTEKPLAAVTLDVDLRLLSAVSDFVSGISESLGIEFEDATEIGKVTKNSLQYLFNINTDESENAPVIVQIYVLSGEFLVAIEYSGLPVELNDANGFVLSPFSLSISSPAIDRVNLINRGKSGQRIELIKKLPSKIYEVERVGDLLGNEATVGNSEEFEIRTIGPDEGLKLSRCFYRVYGYSYGPSYVYYPDRLKSLIESGRLVSVGAFDNEGEIVAHGAMVKQTAETKIGELISLAVDPRYRGSKLATKVHLHLIEHARDEGMKGLFGEAVTIHPYSQRLCRSLGGLESAIMLGFVPPADYKGISEKGFRKRQMAIVYFFPLERPGPRGQVFAPLNCQDILEKIYVRLGFPREFSAKIAVPWGLSCGETALRITVNNDIMVASIAVDTYCPDTVKIIEFRLRQLIKEGIEYISLDLPLGDPLTPYFAQELELIGFFFAGVIPFLMDGDALRLQFLNAREVNFDSALIESQFGKELSNYVLTKHQCVI
ncbi:MAG: GNAT family N-acetyltransferase [Desulfomonilaceae bacterium]